MTIDTATIIEQCRFEYQQERSMAFGDFNGPLKNISDLRLLEGSLCIHCATPLKITRYMIGNVTNRGSIYDGLHCGECEKFYTLYKVGLYISTISDLSAYTVLLCQYCGNPTEIGKHHRMRYGDGELYLDDWLVGLICTKCDRCFEAHSIEFNEEPIGDWEEVSNG